MNETQTTVSREEKTTEIDLVELFYTFVRNWVWIVIAFVIGAVIAAVITVTMIPDKYTATSRMYMVSASADKVLDLSDLNVGSSLSSDYVELMKTRPIIEGVIENLHLEEKYSYEALLSMCNFSVVQDTRIIRIDATSEDPQEAQQIAYELAKKTQEQLPALMKLKDSSEPVIVERAILPEHKSSPSLTKNTAIGALIGLIIMLAFLTIRHLMDDTLKTAEDIEKEFGVMPLSVIPEGKIEGLIDTSDDPRKRRGLKRGSKRKKTNAKKTGGK